ncbi:MAG: hypothetical protein BZ136_00815 [Methanosphaera sp. rholeuAM74]|nr:MAG: hypothetical protein BZ136_00815 [Methanosphaera sp. rholeuAM74]
MYEKIFGKYPQVKVINYILVNPERNYTKKEIAIGAQISRVTLDSFIDNLLENNIIEKVGSTYSVNTNSKIVKTLIKTQITLADLSMKDELQNEEEIIGELVSDDEFEEFMNSFDYEIDEEYELNRLEQNDKMTSDSVDLLNNKNLLFSEELDESLLYINGYYPKNKNRRMINYG